MLKKLVRPLIALPPLQNSFLEELNPASGHLTQESDRIKIRDLMQSLEKHIKRSKYGYTGEFNSMDLPHGLGKLIYGNGNIYEGQFENGKRHGTGTLILSDGGSYIGEWKNDKKSGVGTWNVSFGDSYSGEFLDDRIDGKGVLILANGIKISGIFSNSLPAYGTIELFDGTKVYSGAFNPNTGLPKVSFTFAYYVCKLLGMLLCCMPACGLLQFTNPEQHDDHEDPWSGKNLLVVSTKEVLKEVMHLNIKGSSS